MCLRRARLGSLTGTPASLSSEPKYVEPVPRRRVDEHRAPAARRRARPRGARRRAPRARSALGRLSSMASAHSGSHAPHSSGLDQQLPRLDQFRGIPPRARACGAVQLLSSTSLSIEVDGMRSALALLGVAVAWREALDERLSRSIGAETVVLSDARSLSLCPRTRAACATRPRARARAARGQRLGRVPRGARARMRRRRPREAAVRPQPRRLRASGCPGFRGRAPHDRRWARRFRALHELSPDVPFDAWLVRALARHNVALLLCGDSTSLQLPEYLCCDRAGRAATRAWRRANISGVAAVKLGRGDACPGCCGAVHSRRNRLCEARR